MNFIGAGGGDLPTVYVLRGFRDGGAYGLLSRLIVFTVVFAQFLFICNPVYTAADVTETRTRNFPPSHADPDGYHWTLSSQDPIIFAGSISTRSGRRTYPAPTTVHGNRTVLKISYGPEWMGAAGLVNTDSTAFRAGVLSEIFVAMAVHHLEISGALPFARADPIPSRYLPDSYTGGATFVNPSFPSAPITLNMLLQHVSSITERGFELGAAAGLSATAPTLSAFVSSLFSTPNLTIFDPVIPGLSDVYVHSRTNTAIVCYIVERVLADSDKYRPLRGIDEFVFDVVLPPLQLSNTLLVDGQGNVVIAMLLFTGLRTRVRPHYPTRQDVDKAKGHLLGSTPAHASYLLDFMLFTTAADIKKLVTGVLLPAGFYDPDIGAAMLKNVIPIPSLTMRYVRSRTTGLLFFNLIPLCSLMQGSVDFRGDVLFCSPNSSADCNSGLPYGLVSKSGLRFFSFVCMPIVGVDTPLCSVANISFEDSIWPSGDEAAAGGRSVSFAMAGLAYAIRENAVVDSHMETNHKQPSTWLVLVSVLSILIAVLIASYLTDLILQPLPPEDTMVPVPTGQMGVSGSALVGFGEPAHGDNSEVLRRNDPHSAFQRFAAALDGRYPPLHFMRSVQFPASHSPPLRRRRSFYREDLVSDVINYDEDSVDGNDLGEPHFTPRGPQQYSPNTALHFDAYI